MSDLKYGRHTLVLTLVAGCAAVLVAAVFNGVPGVYGGTKTLIAANEAKVKEEALKTVFPDADSFKPLGGEGAGRASGVQVAAKGDKKLGYAAIGTAMGYGGPINVVTGLDADLDKGVVLKGIEVLPGYQETPGLGAKLAQVETSDTLWSKLGACLACRRCEPEKKAAALPRPWFQKQFSGCTQKELAAFISSPKAPGQKIVPITAATITSKAVANAVEDGVGKITQAVGDGGTSAGQ